LVIDVVLNTQSSNDELDSTITYITVNDHPKRMKNNTLTANEKLVLYGLVRHPLLNNRALSEALGLKQSTVTVIHRKLKKKGYVRTVRVPLLQNLGCEMLAVTYGTFSSSMPLKTRLRISSGIAEEYDEVFWAVSDMTQGATLQMARSYTDVRRKMDGLERTYCKHNVIREPSITLLPFPFELTKIVNFFDFAPLLRQAFDLDIDDVETTTDRRKTDRGAPLNETEKLIYCTLVRHPELSDKELAEVIPVSRHTIARARKRFEDDALIRTIRLVDLKKLGFEILVLNHFVFDMKAPAKRMEEGVAALVENQQPIFMVIGEVEGVSLVPYRSFEDFREHSGDTADVNKRYGLFSRDPVSLLFSITDMASINDHDYAPIAEKVLGVRAGEKG